MGQLEKYLDGWQPTPLTERDDLSPRESARFAALINGTAAETGPLPPLWHWFHFLGWPQQNDIGEDGHPRNGHFLPPIPDRRRMFAGGRLNIVAPLELGVPAERLTQVSNVAVKQGVSGEMAFVTVRSEYRQNETLRLVEEQDIVYRSGECGARQFPAPVPLEDSDAALQATPAVSPSLLFRFSAITANAHRIHYDDPYTREVEGYPGLVVHGPLLVLLMLELVRDKAVRSVSFRLRQPVFVGDQFRVTGSPNRAGASLAVVTGSGTEHATAEVTFE